MGAAPRIPGAAPAGRRSLVDLLAVVGVAPWIPGAAPTHYPLFLQLPAWPFFHRKNNHKQHTPKSTKLAPKWLPKWRQHLYKSSTNRWRNPLEKHPPNNTKNHDFQKPPNPQNQLFLIYCHSKMRFSTCHQQSVKSSPQDPMLGQFWGPTSRKSVSWTLFGLDDISEQATSQVISRC